MRVGRKERQVGLPGPGNASAPCTSPSPQTAEAEDRDPNRKPGSEQCGGGNRTVTALLGDRLIMMEQCTQRKESGESPSEHSGRLRQEGGKLRPRLGNLASACLEGGRDAALAPRGGPGSPPSAGRAGALLALLLGRILPLTVIEEEETRISKSFGRKEEDNGHLDLITQRGPAQGGSALSSAPSQQGRHWEAELPPTAEGCREPSCDR